MNLHAEPDWTDAPLVAVVEDDELVLRALLRLLRTAGYQVEGFDSVEAFFQRFAWQSPACLVLDLHLPMAGGIELLERLQREKHFVPAVVITAHASGATAQRAKSAGAFEFLEKPFENSRLLTAVSTAVTGGVSQQGRERAELRARLEELTSHERMVLEMLAEGMPETRIAGRFQTADSTIKAYRKRAMEKLGAHSVSELVRLYASAVAAPPQRGPTNT